LAAVQARISEGDRKVFYVNTSGFLTEDNKLKYLADSTHPNELGKEYLSTLLANKILEINPPVVIE
jgi:regulator of protease activity HflC (stomatin/prohibitin superfamily)